MVSTTAASQAGIEGTRRAAGIPSPLIHYYPFFCKRRCRRGVHGLRLSGGLAYHSTRPRFGHLCPTRHRMIRVRKHNFPSPLPEKCDMAEDNGKHCGVVRWPTHTKGSEWRWCYCKWDLCNTPDILKPMVDMGCPWDWCPGNRKGNSTGSTIIGMYVLRRCSKLKKVNK